MPLYDYHCDSCGETTEVLQHFDAEPLAACPKCGGCVTKMPSAPALQFKGTGWYVTDYGRSAGRAASGAAEAKTATRAKSAAAETKSGTGDKAPSAGETKPAARSDAPAKPTAKPAAKPSAPSS